MNKDIKKIINFIMIIFVLFWTGIYILFTNNLITKLSPVFQKLYFFLFFLIPIWGIVIVIINYKISKKEINSNKKTSTSYWTIYYSIVSTYILWSSIIPIIYFERDPGLGIFSLIILAPIVFFFNIFSILTYCNKIKNQNHHFLDRLFYYFSLFLILSYFLIFFITPIINALNKLIVFLFKNNEILLKKVHTPLLCLIFFLFFILIAYIITKIDYNNKKLNI